jgi:hypothetical protein
MPKTRSRAKRGFARKVPSAMFHAMGFLIGAASSADYLLGCLILRLVGNAHGITVGHAYPLVAGMEARTKITMIRIFLKMFRLDEQQRMNKILDQISAMFDRRNEIAHSLVQREPTGGPLKFQDLRARIKLGEMPQAQVRTAKEIAGYGRRLLKLCKRLELEMTRAGVLTSAELYVSALARLAPESQMAHSEAESPPPHPTKRRTRRKPSPSKD